ncbi:hypothetical protein [Kitasatospora sp. NPDC005856]|uniref:hypothetical protein n=1 Tax=Kitasatospora sp. NPDC005856 TaxID=3154566 RepID=UPI00340F3E85
MGRPGGRIVYPWDRLGYVALTVSDDAVAHGWVHGLAQFMGDRTGPAQAAGGHPAYAAVRGDAEPEARRVLDREPAALEDWHLRFALRVAVPDAVLSTERSEDGPVVLAHDGDSSWAEVRPGADGRPVLWQGGPRRIGDELILAWAQWESLGRPDPYDYGVTVTHDAPWAWQGSPDGGPRWPIGGPLPAGRGGGQVEGRPRAGHGRTE